MVVAYQVIYASNTYNFNTVIVRIQRVGIGVITCVLICVENNTKRTTTLKLKLAPSGTTTKWSKVGSAVKRSRCSLCLRAHARYAKAYFWHGTSLITAE